LSFQPAEQLSEAVRRADIALYAAKRRSRGSVAIFSTDMQEEVERRTSIEQALREPGLAENIDLAFQPIFDLKSMELKSFEALARWRHSELGWIPPSEFIPITEQLNVVQEISEALLKRAARVARQWPKSVQLSFNLSGVQLSSAETASNVLRILAEEGIEPSRLQVEVTETALLSDYALARSSLSRLRRMGVRIVLDDFGAGYSSISYLREMHFDALKLDGSLMTAATETASGLALLRGVLALSRAMGQECVAEHIETDEQKELLIGLGCRYGQGFQLSRPISASAATRLALGLRAAAA
jgi:predicted signal transduction protein with EAL and GGDEF domain